MRINEEVFRAEYAGLYEKAQSEAKGYVAHPEKLQADIDSKKKERDPLRLRAPEPDQYAYRMMHYQGFARFPERLKNFIVAKNEPKSLARSFLPAIMDVEPNSRCNFRCIMCQVSEWGKGGRARDMTYDELKKFMESQPYLTEVKLHGMGDPFLNKFYNDMVKYPADKSIWVRTSTNASLLHINKNYQKLIDAGIGEVQVSFDGATKDVCERIRRGSNYERIVQNCTMLNNYANRQKRPYTRMWVLLQKYNRHQVFDFVEMADKMGFRRMTFSITLNDWGQENWNIKNRDLQAKQGFSDEEENKLAELAIRYAMDVTVWKQADKYSTNSPDTLCPWPFTRPYISCDLRVVPCCMIANPQIADFGDANDFEQIWNGPGYQAFRRAHIEGNIPQYCRSCYDLTDNT